MTIMKPSIGERLSVAWANSVVDEIRSLRISGGPGVRVTRGANGTTISVPSVSDMEKTDLGRAWDIKATRVVTSGSEEYAEWDIVNCYYSIGGVFGYAKDSTTQQRVDRITVRLAAKSIVYVEVDIATSGVSVGAYDITDGFDGFIGEKCMDYTKFCLPIYISNGEMMPSVDLRSMPMLSMMEPAQS